MGGEELTTIISKEGRAQASRGQRANEEKMITRETKEVSLRKKVVEASYYPRKMKGDEKEQMDKQESRKFGAL